MKTICIYHKNCFDGICAAWVVSKVYPNAELVPMSYGDSLQWLFHNRVNEGVYTENDNLIIVDFSFKRDVMINLRDLFPNITVLDHHKTAEANCKGLPFCHFDMNESGASMAWKWFFENQPLPMVVRYVKDRDLWQFKEMHSEAINAFIQSWPMTIESYDMLSQMLEHDLGFERALQGGTSINRYKQTMVQAMCANAAFQSEAVYPYFPEKIPIVNASMLFSEVGHELCKMFPDSLFGAYYFDRPKDGIRQWGLRSIGNFDVSEIAKQHGGGGHKNAAGFEQSLSAI